MTRLIVSKTKGFAGPIFIYSKDDTKPFAAIKYASSRSPNKETQSITSWDLNGDGLFDLRLRASASNPGILAKIDHQWVKGKPIGEDFFATTEFKTKSGERFTFEKKYGKWRPVQK